MEGHAQKCLVRYCELANKRVEQLYKVSNPEWTSSLTRWTVIIWKIAINLYLARIGGPDILRSVNKLARSVTKRTQESDKCLARLISYIHVKTSNIVMWETRHSIADWVCLKTPICRRSWGFNIYIKWNIVHFRKQYLCSIPEKQAKADQKVLVNCHHKFK